MVHGFDDLFADLDAGQGVVALFDLRRADRLKLLDRDGFAVLAHRHEDHHALAAHGGRAALGIAGGDDGADVHGGPAGVDDGGLHLHHVAAVDRIREVDVAHVCRDAVGLVPSPRRRHRRPCPPIPVPSRHPRSRCGQRPWVPPGSGGSRSWARRSQSCCDLTEAPSYPPVPVGNRRNRAARPAGNLAGNAAAPPAWRTDGAALWGNRRLAGAGVNDVRLGGKLHPFADEESRMRRLVVGDVLPCHGQPVHRIVHQGPEPEVRS